MSAANNPFAAMAKALAHGPAAAMPKLCGTPSIRVFISGERIKDMRQVDRILETRQKDREPCCDGKAERAAALEADALKGAIQKAKDAAKYQKERAKPEAIARRKAYAAANREYHNAALKKWAADNRARLCELRRAYYAKHTEAEKARTRAYYQANKEKIAARLAAKKKAQREAQTDLVDVPEYSSLRAFITAKESV